MKNWICIELGSTFVMIIVIYFVAIYTLWDDVYVQMIEDDANTSPIIDVKFVTKDDGCPGDFETIAKAYWWGLKQGCSCTGGSAAAARLEICTDKEARSQDCIDSKARDDQWLPIINGHKVCGKRANYNLHDMTKPDISKDGSSYQCKDPSKQMLCGDNPSPSSVGYENVWCINKNDKVCPLTNIKFSNG